MKFLFLRPAPRINGKSYTPFPMSHPPLGLLYIGAVLEQEGHKVEVLDYFAEDVSTEQLKNSLISADAVGITFIDNCKPTADLSRIVKEIDPEIPLIIGGPYCTFLPKQSLLNIPDADICVIGEGEQAIVDLVKYLKGRKKLSDIHGVFYRNNKSLKMGKHPNVNANLDTLPFPARHLVEKYDYGITPWGYKLKNKATAIITSRGCPFQCRFCAKYSNAIKNWSFRKRSAENVVKEIQEIKRNYRSIMIVDDNFLADKKRAHRIFDMLLENGSNIELFIEGARVDTAEKELYLKMKKAGVKSILYGIESGNQDVLDFYKKNITISQVKKAVKLAKEMNFLIYTSFIFGAPIETKKHFENTIKFACSLPIDFTIFAPLRYLTGSSLWNEAVKNKKISSSNYTFMADSKHDLGNFTREELMEYSFNAYKTFYLRPKYILSQFYRTILRNDYRMLINGLKFLPMVNRFGN